MTKKTWDLNININLRAPLLLIQKFEKQLPKSVSGNIINIIDQRVWNLTPYFTSYTISKTGLWTLTKTLAMVLSPKIRVNAVGPGPTFPSKYQTKKGFDRQVRSTILKKRIKTQDICNAIDWSKSWNQLLDLHLDPRRSKRLRMVLQLWDQIEQGSCVRKSFKMLLVVCHDPETI